MKTKEQIKRKIKTIKRLERICHPDYEDLLNIYEGSIDMLEWVISKEPITAIDGSGGGCIVWDYDKEEFVKVGDK
jgi:hypothetical protein